MTTEFCLYIPWFPHRLAIIFVVTIASILVGYGMGYIAGLHAAVTNTEDGAEDTETSSRTFSDDCNIGENNTDGLLAAMNDGSAEGVKGWAKCLGDRGHGKQVSEEGGVVKVDRRSRWRRFWPPPCERLKGSR